MPYPGVEEFITSNNLDEEASKMLLACSPSIQKEVTVSRKDGGVRDLDGVNNPSRAVLSRIHKAQRASGGGGGRTYPGVQEFIASNNLDEEASRTLLACSPSVQKEVIVSRKDGGVRDLNGINNPSRAVLSRIRKAKASSWGDGGMDDMGSMGMNPMMMGMNPMMMGMNPMQMQGMGGMGGMGGMDEGMGGMGGMGGMNPMMMAMMQGMGEGMGGKGSMGGMGGMNPMMMAMMQGMAEGMGGKGSRGGFGGMGVKKPMFEKKGRWF